VKPIEGTTKPATAAPLEEAELEEPVDVPVPEVPLLPELPSMVLGVEVDVQLKVPWMASFSASMSEQEKLPVL
jgi:hypothetical protein